MGLCGQYVGAGRQTEERNERRVELERCSDRAGKTEREQTVSMMGDGQDGL